MTAIFAYAHEGTAFVAGDTRRVAPSGMATSVCKVHQWSEGVVFAQAGEAQFLTQLIGAFRPQMGFYPPTVEGLFDCFRQLNETFWGRAEVEYAKKGKSVTEGTILVACVSTTSEPARIFKVDFQTGNAVPCVGPVAADGTDPSTFLAIATQNLSTARGTCGAGVQLDLWASRCVKEAAETHPKYIGFPVDLLIARQSEGHRVLVQRRLTNEDATPNQLFHAP